jgi:sugar lactone lactonase YvrE
MKVWLKGEKAGTAETFVDLPGNPDNIRLGSDGHFWIALIQVTGSRFTSHIIHCAVLIPTASIIT